MHTPADLEARRRTEAMLRSAMGPALVGWLADPLVSEIMLNADGRVWLDRLDGGLAATQLVLSPPDAERILRLAAHHAGAEVHAGAPRLSVELPAWDARLEGLLPPVTAAPVFSIRRPAGRTLRLADYVAAGVMGEAVAAALAGAVRRRRNILVAGATSSGKTTLAGALVAEMAEAGERLVLIEDLRELRCATPNAVALRTTPEVGLRDLVRTALRLRPDRIIVGEVRGGEALELLKAWATGHPGGVATVHAEHAAGALGRLEQLVLEATAAPPRELVADTIHVIAVLAGRGERRRLSELVALDGLDPAGGYRLRPLILET